MKPSEYIAYDAMGLNELITKKELSAHEVLEAAIARCELVNPDINALTHKMYDHAHAQLALADTTAPLYGVPFLLKDLSLNYAGVVTTQGSRFFKNCMATEDSELVRRHKKAGLITIGKTNTPEFGTNWVTESVAFGSCRNPYDLSKTPGGSSGGSAAAVAAGITPIAHASDGGGSIRVPASCCGLIGLKPTRARVPVGPERGESSSGLSVHHGLSRSVRDCALLLDIAKGAEVGDPYAAPVPPTSYLKAMQRPLPTQLKIGVVTQAPGGYPLDRDCLQAVRQAVGLCEDLNARIDEVVLTADNDALKAATSTIWAANIAASLDVYAQHIGREYTSDDVEPANFYFAQLGCELKAKDYVLALDTIHRAGREMGRLMQRFDLLLTPTLAQLPVSIGALFYTPDKGSVSDFYRDHGFAFSPFTSLFNVSGQPAISLPLYFTASGLPVGVQFAAAFGNELLLLQLAYQLCGHASFGRIAPLKNTFST